MRNLRLVDYILIAAIHTGFLGLQCGDARSAVITIQVGQHQPRLAPYSTQPGAETDTPLTGQSLFVYQEADWFNWPIFAGDGTPTVDYQLVFDGGGSEAATAIPEAGTCSLALVGLLSIALLKIVGISPHAKGRIFAKPVSLLRIPR